MDRNTPFAIRYGALAMALACITALAQATHGEHGALLMDVPSYEVHPLTDDRCNYIAWYVKGPSTPEQEVEASDKCDVWRTRVRASLCSYRRSLDVVGLAVRLTANPTIRNMVGKGCFVERIVGAVSQDFAFECRVGGCRQPFGLFASTMLTDVGGNDMITMCAYGREPLHGEGSTLECALFLKGLATLVFAYSVDAGVGVRILNIPIPDDSQPDSANACRGIVSIYDARRSITVSVKDEKILGRDEVLLILTFQSPGEFAIFPISMKNVLTLREILKKGKNRLDCCWKPDVTELDRSPLFF